jgi:hypothetical protein
MAAAMSRFCGVLDRVLKDAKSKVRLKTFGWSAAAKVFS